MVTDIFYGIRNPIQLACIKNFMQTQLHMAVVLHCQVSTIDRIIAQQYRCLGFVGHPSLWTYFYACLQYEFQVFYWCHPRYQCDFYLKLIILTLL